MASLIWMSWAWTFSRVVILASYAALWKKFNSKLFVMLNLLLHNVWGMFSICKLVPYCWIKQIVLLCLAWEKIFGFVAVPVQYVSLSLDWCQSTTSTHWISTLQVGCYNLYISGREEINLADIRETSNLHVTDG